MMNNVVDMERQAFLNYVQENFSLNGGVAGRMLDNILLYAETLGSNEEAIAFVWQILDGTMGLEQNEVARLKLV